MTDSRGELITGTIQENFNKAMQQERIAAACGNDGPYWRTARMNVNYYLNCAAALERGETHIMAWRV